jgi:hypothetical protein
MKARRASSSVPSPTRPFAGSLLADLEARLAAEDHTLDDVTLDCLRRRLAEL